MSFFSAVLPLKQFCTNQKEAPFSIWSSAWTPPKVSDGLGVIR